jgi:hypothetical protein
MKNHAVFFCENKNPEYKKIRPNAKVFCVPFYKIQETMEFCELEEIYSAYLGFRNGRWCIDADKTRMDPYIRITKDGIHENNKKRYVWVMKRISLPQDPCRQYKFPVPEHPNF